MNITASIKGVIQRGIAQVTLRDGHLCLTLTDGTYLDLGVVVGRGIADASLQDGKLVLTFTDGTNKNVGVVAGRGIVKAQRQQDRLVLTFSDGATQDVGEVVGRGIKSIAKTATAGTVDTYTLTYTDGNTWSYTVQNGSDAVFSGTLQEDLRLQGGALRFQSAAGNDLLALSAATDPDGTVRLGSDSRPIRMGTIAPPRTPTDAVNKEYVDRLLSDSVNAIDDLIGGSV